MHLLRYLLCAASASQPQLLVLTPPPRPRGPRPAAPVPVVLTPPPPPRGSLPAGSAGQPDPPEPADLGHPPLGEPVGGHRGRHALLVPQREDLLGCHVD